MSASPTPLRIALIAAATLVFSYYHWQVRSAGFDIAWEPELNGYYNHLARGLLAGHLYLPVQPAPALLALPNPWDPKVENVEKLFDGVLYNRRYYLYHGVAPALLLFVPWRFLTHRDLPESAAILALAFAGWLFASGALLGLLQLQGRKPNPALLFFALLVLGSCQAMPFLLNRVWVYEVAIAGGYFCISAAIFFLARYLNTRHPNWLLPAGFFFGAAIACRPHLGLTGSLALLFLLWKHRPAFLKAALPFALVAAAVCWYNFARFGDPFEFGTRYLLGGANQTEVHWRLSNLERGFNFLLWEPPLFSPVFPWFHAAPRPISLPLTYTLEPIIGALWLCPVLILLPFAFRRSRASADAGALPVLLLLITSSAGVILFLAGTGWSLQRYQVDFLPHLLLAALAAAPLAIPPVLMLPGLAISLALGITGPYDEMLRNRPTRYAKIAGWFSPNPKLRPQLNPPLAADFTRPATRPDGTTEILLAAGPQMAHYELRLTHAFGKATLTSEFGFFGDSKAKAELPPATSSRHLAVRYNPADMTLTVTEHGEPVLTHKFGPFVAAPTEIVTAAPNL